MCSSLFLDSSEDGVVGGFASIHVRAARPDRSISYIVLIIRHITPGYRHSIGRSLDILKLNGNIGRQWTRAVLRRWTTQCSHWTHWKRASFCELSGTDRHIHSFRRQFLLICLQLHTRYAIHFRIGREEIRKDIILSSGSSYVLGR